ncbi:hypothetical protein Y032_0625g802 [Ancylostoma ceylanicum]|uniref:ABC transporter domain-containing protein n=1 Tax=Ancylostoma ceylanicum TaxID=53326 RepID=A0A016WK46_9BILA|nr:hypothetical protein Y032_0625g802 [Ancylostoma ceylanicum]
MRTKEYTPTSEISEGEDVVEEREHVVNKAADLVLSVEDLTKFYGKLCALKRTTYGIEHGECFGLVGASGSGKTTTFEIITGFRPASYGTVMLNNGVATRNVKLGYCPQFDAMLPRLSCFENVALLAGLTGYRYAERKALEALHIVDLMEHRHKAFINCSGGQKRRLSTAATVISSSELLILDEPTAGVDPKVMMFD